MSIKALHFRKLVIEPVLREIEAYSEAAVEMLLGTAAQESHLGTYLTQVPTGPARGPYQMERATFDDIHRNYLSGRKDLAARVARFVCPCEQTAFEQMAWNLGYATAMARVHYLRVKMPLPAASDLRAQSSYWKRHWNTPLGRGTEEQYMASYRRLVAGVE